MTRRALTWLAGPGLLAAAAVTTAITGGLLLALALTPHLLERLWLHVDGQPSLVVLPALGTVWAALTVLRPAPHRRVVAPAARRPATADAPGQARPPGGGRDAAPHQPTRGSRQPPRTAPAGDGRRVRTAAAPGPSASGVSSFAPGRASLPATTLVLPGVTP